MQIDFSPYGTLCKRFHFHIDGDIESHSRVCSDYGCLHVADLDNRQTSDEHAVLSAKAAGKRRAAQ